MKTMFIQCVQCDVEFEFSVQEQMLYFKKGYDDPRRCPGCRKNKSKISVRDGSDRGNKKNKKRQYHLKYADELQ